MNNKKVRAIKNSLGLPRHPIDFTPEQKRLYRQTKRKYKSIIKIGKNRQIFLDSTALVRRLLQEQERQKQYAQ